MEKFYLTDDESIQNHRASRDARWARLDNLHKNSNWRLDHTHELCAKTFNLPLRVLSLLKINNIRFFGSYQRIRAVAAMYGVKTVFILG